MAEKISDTEELILSSYDILALAEDVLNHGGSLRFTAKGFSMKPSIKHNDIVTVSSVEGKRLRVGDVILLRKDKDSQVMVHRIRKIKGKRYITRGDNSYENDGWITRDMIYGFISKVERDGENLYWPAREGRSIINRFLIYGYLGLLKLRSVYRQLLMLQVKKDR